jgi:hypothetical protein
VRWKVRRGGGGWGETDIAAACTISRKESSGIGWGEEEAAGVRGGEGVGVISPRVDTCAIGMTGAASGEG